MKKIVLFLALCLSACNIFASNLDRIVFFGDSLTDNGNLYGYLLHVLPKSPPYYQGRFSNGPTWAEIVAKYYYDRHYTASSNYAVGGATALFHPISTKFISPATIEVEIYKYLLDSLLKLKSNTLYSLWIGGNDYLYYSDKDINVLTTRVVNKTLWAMTYLHKHGAKSFLVLNLPDLAKVPEVIRNGDSDILRIVTSLHNQKLHEAIVEFRSKNSDVSVIEVDINALYEAALHNPEEFNKRFNINLSNLEGCCYDGGLFFSKNINNYDLKTEINQAIEQASLKNSSEIDADAISEFITKTPGLSKTYRLGRAYTYGAKPCSNPDSFLYWDHMHPTAIVHSILAQVVIEALTKESF